MAETRLLDTPHGPARVHLHQGLGDRRGTLVLGHGAGGSVEAPDLQAVTAGVVALGVDVVLVEQPYRVAGRRSAAPAKQLDVAWVAVLEQLDLVPGPLLVGGRSSGARVACRTAAATGAHGVLCLAFPLVTPKGASRQDELDGAGVPVLVIQGRSDRFGMPEPGLSREVVQVDGDHALRRDHDAVVAAVTAWIAQRLTPATA
ncbi:MAG: alpha/beta hydrolase [Solirubrobacteraceae bacterium]|nr:alpha/beta hydrolase [Solirubrobacteraceae bacterium]